MRTNSLNRLVTACAAVLLLGACTGGEDPAASTSDADPSATGYGGGSSASESSGDDGLPPSTAPELADLFEDRLASLGVELTERSALVGDDRGSSEYGPDGSGDHLALYVVPTEPWDDDAYVDGILEITAAFADVFQRWPELASFDVCQEFHDDHAEADRHLTATLVDLTRETAGAVDWDDLELAGLLATVEPDEGSQVRVFGSLALHPELRQARRDAGLDGWGS